LSKASQSSPKLAKAHQSKAHQSSPKLTNPKRAKANQSKALVSFGLDW